MRECFQLLPFFLARLIVISNNQWVMRITIDIPDPLHRKLRKKTKKNNCSMRELIIRGVQQELGVRCPPVIHSKHPGSVCLDNARIFKIIPFP